MKVTSRQPGQDGSTTPVRGFVVIDGDTADDDSAFLIENPARLLRVWSLPVGAGNQPPAA